MPPREKKEKQPVGWAVYYRVIRRIPKGRVTTYGAIAEFANRPRSARHVGYALAALRGSEHDIPWHRVLGSRSRTKAKVTIRDPIGGAVQRELLMAEGVEFDESGNVSLTEFAWAGPKRRKPKTNE